MSEFKNLTLDVADGIAVLAISRPAALNALNSETLDELNVCLSEIEVTTDNFAINADGGLITIHVASNTEFTVTANSEWISQVETRALTTKNLNNAITDFNDRYIECTTT